MLFSFVPFLIFCFNQSSEQQNKQRHTLPSCESRRGKLGYMHEYNSKTINGSLPSTIEKERSLPSGIITYAT